MAIKTLSQPACIPANHPLVANRTAGPRVIVAPEGSELASELRSSGWVARSGWRSYASGRPAIWFVRFESPHNAMIDAAA